MLPDQRCRSTASLLAGDYAMNDVSSAALCPSGHTDGFARAHLPPPDTWPDFLFDLPELQYPERLNCASVLLDGAIARGRR
jgi:2-aminobenzoate-CoA ligase